MLLKSQIEAQMVLEKLEKLPLACVGGRRGGSMCLSGGGDGGAEAPDWVLNVFVICNQGNE